ncbi:unannotated protein [freshwater metagenome]|uniref:Unannotated protein n=1 Tax=freshwater metagenome TaxID=449393 RepID=A0A6J7DDI8_9ZZZZ|nr:ring-cleaving dioxygenase [Actinomycetota bacterium]
MHLSGLHHVTMITGDAQRNVAFHAGVLGLRFVKRTVNFDAPHYYHLYFGDEAGSPGSILTWFEFPGAVRGTCGPGMIHTIRLGVPSSASLDFWGERLAGHDAACARGDASLSFADPDGLRYELVVADPRSRALQALSPDIPAEHAITGVTGVRAYATGALGADRELLTQTLGFTETAPGEYVLEGADGPVTYGYDMTDSPGREGAGTVHHIAWHSRDEDHGAWRERVMQAGHSVTPVVDRDYFQAIYFRQPQRVLFEIATTSPGFAVDEEPGRLGEQLRLPVQHEHLRAQLERTLLPLTAPRATGAAPSGDA